MADLLAYATDVAEARIATFEDANNRDVK